MDPAFFFTIPNPFFRFDGDMKLLLSLAILFLPKVFYAQYSDTLTTEVAVTGMSHLYIKPDMAVILVNVQYTKPYMRDAILEVNQTVKKVIQSLKLFIPDSQDIKVSLTHTSKEYAWVNDRSVFQGFKAAKNLKITIKKIENLDTVVTLLQSTRIQEISKVDFTHSQLDSLRDHLMKEAIKDGYRQVQIIGEQVKKDKIYLSSILDRNWTVNNRQDIQLEVYGKALGNQGFKISPGELDLKVTMPMRFRIKM